MNLVRFTIETTSWGPLLILRPIPHKGDIWGELAPVKDTYLEPLIPVVSGENLTHALYGHATPLMGEIGPAPRSLLKRVRDRQCEDFGQCIMAKVSVCHPCAKLPECYAAPGVSEGQVQMVASAVVLAWAEDRYVFVVAGGEFSL